MAHTTQQIADASNVENGLEDMYLRDINSAFDGVPLCDKKHGIHHQCPAEMLHAHGNDIIEKQFQVLVDMLGPNKQNMKNTSRFRHFLACIDFFDLLILKPMS